MDFYSRRSLIWSTASHDPVHHFAPNPRLRITSACDKSEAVTLVGRARRSYPEENFTVSTGLPAWQTTSYVVARSKCEIIPVYIDRGSRAAAMSDMLNETPLLPSQGPSDEVRVT